MSASTSLTKFEFWEKPIRRRLDEYIISDIKQNAFILDVKSWELINKLLLLKILSL